MERNSFYYMPIINAIGLKTLSKIPDIPDNRLGIGFSEDLSPKPLIIYSDFVAGSDYNKIVRPAIEDVAFEDTNPDRLGQTLSLDDFDTTSFWLGSGGI